MPRARELPPEEKAASDAAVEKAGKVRNEDRRFEVVIGGVSGRRMGPAGRHIPHDFYGPGPTRARGDIVTEADLCDPMTGASFTAGYLAAGDIKEIEG